MFDKNDPVGQMGKILGLLFAIMADAIITKCGEEVGIEIVKDAVYRFGFIRGKKIREKVLSAGEEITFENFEKYYDIPANNGWDCDSQVTEDRLWEYTRYCPYAEAWKELGIQEIGKLYCEMDKSIIEGYMGDVEFIRPKLFCNNEEGCCEMIINKKG